jgi:RNA polymerase sigma-70 factor, ECF subfamily
MTDDERPKGFGIIERDIAPTVISGPILHLDSMEKRPRVGQADDIAERYRDYLPRVLNYVRLRVGDDDLAQDLAAAAFERAVAAQHTLRRREAFGAWLFRIARNVVAGYYRGWRPTLPLEYADDQPAPDPGPPEVAMRAEELARLRAAVATLSEREQEIVRLKFGAGLGNQEIAAVLRLQAGHVAVLLYRALHKLRDRLEEE